jgi:hypothetical protein
LKSDSLNLLEPSGPVQACYGIALQLPLLKSLSVLTAAKIKIYSGLIRPMAKYGAQSWVLSKDTATRLATFERKILGRLFFSLSLGATAPLVGLGLLLIHEDFCAF